MRRLSVTYLLLSFCIVAVSQDFKLFFANNVTDVSDFNDIERATSGLNWREVANGDIAGNQVEVDAVKRMFASAEMKGLSQQQQYWKMRDHSLLCFRIENGEGSSGSFGVEVDDGTGNPQTITVSRFFFTNAPRRDNPLSVRVWRSGEEKSSGIHFRYYVYDWDDDRLYTFNLDAKRQITGETYKIEYVLAGRDENGEILTESRQLDIRDTRFQSFYVPEDRQLQDVFLMSGENRLRINLARLHTGTSPYTRYDITSLTPNFILDKHENRELVNFNALGTGLYEHFDTLYVTLLNPQGAHVSRATINVERVDEEGHRLYDTEVKYLGYDSKKKAHAVLTQGHPVYLEVVADNYLPTVYKYPGAADPITHIVSEELCNATIMLQSGKTDEKGFSIAQQNLYTMNDEKLIVARGGTDYCFCSEEIHDLSRYVPTDTIFYSETCGNNYPKLLNNKPTDRYARLEIVFSRPASEGSVNALLTSVEDASGKSRSVGLASTEVISVNEFPSFTRNYYFQSYDLVGNMSENTACRLLLTSDSYSYDKFPLLVNVYANREEQQKKVDEEVQEKYVGDESDNMNKGFADSDCKLSLPINFKFTFKPVKITSSINLDITHQLFTFMVNGMFMPPPGQDPDEEKEAKLSKQRKEALAAANFGYSVADRDSVSMKNFSNTGVSLKDKVTNDAEDIFAVSPLVGTSWYGGFKVGFKMPFQEKDSHPFILTEASGNIGWMANFPFPNLIDKYLGDGAIGKIVKKVNCFRFGGQFGANIGLNLGIKYFGKNEAMTQDNMGYFATLSAVAKAGVWAEVGLPSNPILNISAGVRAGAKIAFNAGLAGPFDTYAPAAGVELMLYGLVEAYANLRTPIFQWSGKAGAHFGWDGFLPNNGHNPFHPEFPYWLKKNSPRTVGSIYRAPERIESSSMGETLLTDVAIDANPHFLDEKTVLVNHLGQPNNYNDDYVAAVAVGSDNVTPVSQPGLLARNHMRSKRREHEVVVYEQITQTIDASNLNDEQAAEQSNDMANHTRIMSAFRQPDGTWKHLPVSPDADGNMANSKPVVTIQDDGKAACIWQRGLSVRFDPTTPADSIYPYEMMGAMALSTYDGSRWSEPREFATLSHEYTAKQYDLVMRNDTVLIGYLDVFQPHDEKMRASLLRYISKPLNDEIITSFNERIVPECFFMNRVGQHAVIAMVYETTDSLKDIFVKTLRMDGHDDGVGNDLGTPFCQSSQMKIVCDREANDIDDFAILWTEVNNVIREDNGTRTGTEDVKSMLNASRVHLSNKTLTITAPITLGTDQNGLVVTDYDGILDDSRIHVVYTLANPETGGAVVMMNEKFFHNSFESDVTYTREALTTQNVLPVNVFVRNTGTSPILSVTATINNEDFTIPDSYVAPMQQQTFVVAYPVGNDFDGYMTTHVSVDFDNVFKAKKHGRHRAMSLLRQVRRQPAKRLKKTENVELRLVNQSIEEGVNTFVVELIDHSMQGIDENNAVAVGLYAHPSIWTPLSDESEILVGASDFMMVGGKRKAFATLTFDGVTEPTQAYLTTHIVDAKIIDRPGMLSESDATMEDAHVDNLRGFDNAYNVKLYPTEDPSALKKILADGPATHRITIQRENDGVRLSGLEAGEHIRLFNAEGMAVYSGRATQSTLIVPLKQHGVYLLTGNKEVFKITY